jgi:hypothetical protein
MYYNNPFCNPNGLDYGELELKKKKRIYSETVMTVSKIVIEKNTI